MKSRVTSLILTLCMVLSVVPVFSLSASAAGTQPTNGTGTASDPYLIGTADELIWFRDEVNNGNLNICAALTADIALNPSTPWTPIAAVANYLYGYYGTFDGRGHTVSGMNVTYTGINAGFFGCLAGEVKNLHLVGNINSSSSSNGTAGGLAGWMYAGSVTNCSFEGNVWGSEWVGGLIGYTATFNASQSVAIKDSYAFGGTVRHLPYSITSHAGMWGVGGLIGVVESGGVYVNGCFSSMSDYSNTADDWASAPLLGAAGGNTTAAGISFTDCYGDGSNYAYSLCFSNGYNFKYHGWVTYNNTHLYGTYYDAYNNHPGYGWNVGSVGSNFSATNSFVLSPASSMTGLSSITTAQFASDNTFKTAGGYVTADWDFTDTDGNRAIWMMGSQYPVLKPYFAPSYLDGVRYDYYGSTAATADNVIDLSKYIYAVLDTNPSTSARFRYTYTNTNITKRILRTDGTGYDDDTQTSQLVTGQSGDKITLDPDAPVGDYTISVTVHDDNNIYADYSFTIDIRKKVKVPVPEIDSNDQNKTYGTSLTLNDIALDPDSWFWDDTTQVPKPYDASPLLKEYTYDAYYRLDSDNTQPYNTNVAANYTDYYDWPDVDNDLRYTVDTSDIANNRILVKVNPLVVSGNPAPVVAYIHVIDADTNADIDNAQVSCNCGYPDEFPLGNATGAVTGKGTNGWLYAELAAVSSHTFSVTATGYDPVTHTETVYNPGDVIIIKMKRASGSLTVPPVYLRDGVTPPSTLAQNAKVTFTRIDGITNSWVDANGVPLESITENSGDPLSIPMGDATNVVKYKVKSATYRCSTDDTLYMKFDLSTGLPEYYTDENCTIAAGRNYLLATLMGDPEYIMTITEVANTNPQQYEVKLDIKNIKATYGTFGLTFDPDVFDFTGTVGTDITLGTDTNNVISALTTVEQTYSKLNPAVTWDHDKGYYAFIWHSSEGNPDEDIDAELNPVNIAKFYFTLKTGYTTDDASVDWFGIIPWGDTDAAQKAVLDTAHYSGETQVIEEERWRPVDTDNDPLTLGFGRIKRSEAVVNDVDMKGFFQASVNPDLAAPDDAYFFDVKVTMDYQINIVNSILRFHVYDDDPNEPNPDLDQATVDLYDLTSIPAAPSETTNPQGIAKFHINTSSGANGYDFLYNASRQGYWPFTMPGDPMTQVSAPTGKVTNVEVPLKKKIYHKPVMLGSAKTGTLTGNEDLGGEKYAYNGRDFHFRFKAAKGYKVKQYPTSATVYIIDYNGQKLVELSDTLSGPAATGGQTGAALTPDGYGVFTLDKQYLDQTTLKALDQSGDFATLLVKDQTPNNDYASYTPSADPTTDGFRSYNVYIEFNDYELEEIQYQVEGVTNGGGTVSYSTAAPTYASGTVLPEDMSVHTDHYNLVKTTKNDATAGTVTNHQTGTFTFTADQGNVIEKVYINGLRTYIYDGDTSFTYTFGDVDMDCNITVLFYDGDPANANQDTLMTLVVGEYGKVDVTAPAANAETDLSITRRVYLMNTGDSLKFKATPDGNGYYLLNKVEVETVSSGVSTFTPITNTADANGVFTVPSQQGENVVVYVTFKHNNPNPNTTPNLFVKSYVYQGKGVADPAGILIYTMYDDVDIELTGISPNQAKGVVLQPFGDLTTITSTYNFPSLSTSATYTYPSLMSDITIGSVFEEPTYQLTGNVVLDQLSGITTGPCLTGATVRFVRLDDTNHNEKPNQVPYVFTTTTDRTTATFTAYIPAGWWNVYVEKPGYLTYKITEFEMNASSGATQFSAKPIVPYIGSTLADGKYITLKDAANVKSGWRTGVNTYVKDKADVDNDGQVTIYDLNYVWKNFNQRIVSIDYGTFDSYGSGTPSVTGP